MSLLHSFVPSYVRTKLLDKLPVGKRLARSVLSRALRYAFIGSVAGAGISLMTSTAQAAAPSEADVNQYAAAMRQAANSKNISGVSQLIDDDAIIVINRNGQANLSKDAYLKLLQKSWQSSNNYRYDIDVQDVIIVGNEAKATIKTVERFEKDGKPMVYTTISRTTLSLVNNNATLLKAVSQVTIE